MTIPRVTMEELMSQLSRRGDLNSAPDPAVPLIEAQIDELNQIREASLKATAQPVLIGDFVRYIHNSGPDRRELRGRFAYLVWCEFDEDSSHHMNLLEAYSQSAQRTLANPDVILAWINPEIGLMFEPADSALLEPIE